jgi:hypothetical protein
MTTARMFLLFALVIVVALVLQQVLPGFAIELN